MKAFLATLALASFIAQAHASPLHGDRADTCPNPTALGSTIYPNTPCTLGPDQYGSSWKYLGATLYCYNGGCPVRGIAVTASLEAQINTANGAYPRKRIFYLSYMCRLDGNPAPTGWYMNGPTVVQAVSPSASPIGNVFANSRRGTYPTVNAMISAASAGDHLEVPAVPNGLPCWSDGGAVTSNNVTITLNAGSLLGNKGFLGGKANLVVRANNVTINGSKTSYEGLIHGGNVFGIRLDPGYSGLTIDHGTYEDADTCIDTGGYNGTVTLKNLIITECGAGRDVQHGQTHSFYCGLGQNKGYDNSACNVMNVVSMDTLSGGHLLKLRAHKVTVSKTTTYCDDRTRCDVSYDFDVPCGAVADLHQDVFERPPSTENFAFGSFGVEIHSGDASCGQVTGDMTQGATQIVDIVRVPSEHGFTAGIGISCSIPLVPGTIITSITGTGPYLFNLSKPLPSTGKGVNCWPQPPHMSMTLNKDYFIDDGPSPIPGSGNTCLVVNAYAQTYVDVMVKNSILVFNPASSNKALSLGCQGKLHVINGGGNLCYVSRTAAFGPGHDFPYVPPPMLGNPVPNGNEVPCPMT